jgi:hypothetical protein
MMSRCHACGYNLYPRALSAALEVNANSYKVARLIWQL